jgi:alpha-tubulin suppressor-like RCC1 family protein
MCWGRGINGELGLGVGVTSATTPTAVAGGIKFVQVSTGGRTTCGVSVTGEAYCWGSNGDGSLGVGSGSTGSFVPVKVATTQRFVDIAVGFQFACALNGGGDLYCWGAQSWNGGVTAGGATGAITFTPTLLAGGRGYVALAPGGTLGGCALTTNGTAECWGTGGTATLNGNGSLQTMRAPTPVAGALRFTELSMSATHACGRVTDGTIVC